MAERLITVATFSQPTEAHILKGRLEAEGIPCFLGDEHIIAAQPLYSLAVGGVKLQVTEGDEQEAREMIARIQAGRSEYILDDNIELALPGQAHDQKETCPICDSELISESSFLSEMLANLFPFFSMKNNCHSCGYTWKSN